MTNLLYLLPMLVACPLGMGLIMKVMMRGNRGQAMDTMQVPARDTAGQLSTNQGTDARVAALRTQLGTLEARQRGIAARIGELAAAAEPTDPHGGADAAGLRPAAPAARQRGRVSRY